LLCSLGVSRMLRPPGQPAALEAGPSRAVHARGTSLVWLRRDLRLDDNPALAAALKTGGAVVLVYVWAPGEEGQFEPGTCSRWWLFKSLTALSASVRKLGGRLILRSARKVCLLPPSFAPPSGCPGDARSACGRGAAARKLPAPRAGCWGKQILEEPSSPTKALLCAPLSLRRAARRPQRSRQARTAALRRPQPSRWGPAGKSWSGGWGALPRLSPRRAAHDGRSRAAPPGWAPGHARSASPPPAALWTSVTDPSTQSLEALEELLKETGAHSLFFNNLYDANSLVRAATRARQLPLTSARSRATQL